MSLFRTSFWTGLTTMLKVVLNYVMWKIIAVRVGPVGIAVIEQFQSFIQISRVSIPSGINEGIVKYVSEYQDNEKKKADIISNAMAMNIAIFGISFLILTVFSHYFSHLVFQTENHQRLIILTGSCIILFVINNFCLSLLNAHMEVKKYVVCMVANSLLNFILTSYLIIHYGLEGGLIGFALNQTLLGLFSAYLVVRSKWFNIKIFFSKINRDCIIKLAKYACIPLSAALLTPIASFFLTQYVVHSLSWESAGYWQAMMRLSSAYLIVMAMVFGFYFIPKFSSLKENSSLKKEIIKSHYAIFPLIIVGSLLIFLFKKQIIVIIYSTKFMPVIPLFKYQLVGDVARASTWILKNIFVAKAMVKVCITMEVIFILLNILLTVIFVQLKQALKHFLYSSILVIAQSLQSKIKCN